MIIENKLVKKIVRPCGVYHIIHLYPLKLLLVCKMYDEKTLFRTNTEDIGKTILVVNYLKIPALKKAWSTNILLADFKIIIKEINKYLKGQK